MLNLNPLYRVQSSRYFFIHTNNISPVYILFWVSCILGSLFFFLFLAKICCGPKTSVMLSPLPHRKPILWWTFHFYCYFQTSNFSSSSSRDWNKIKPQSMRRTSHLFPHVVGKWTTFAVMTCQLFSPQLLKILTTPVSHQDCWLSVELETL